MEKVTNTQDSDDNVVSSNDTPDRLKETQEPEADDNVVVDGDGDAHDNANIYSNDDDAAIFHSTQRMKKH